MQISQIITTAEAILLHRSVSGIMDNLGWGRDDVMCRLDSMPDGWVTANGDKLSLSVSLHCEAARAALLVYNSLELDDDREQMDMESSNYWTIEGVRRILSERARKDGL